MTKKQARYEGNHIPRRYCEYSKYTIGNLTDVDRLYFCYDMSSFENGKLVTAVFRSHESHLATYYVEDNSHHVDERKVWNAVPRIIKGARNHFKGKNVQCDIKWKDDGYYDQAHIFLYISYKK